MSQLFDTWQHAPEPGENRGENRGVLPKPEPMPDRSVTGPQLLALRALAHAGARGVAAVNLSLMDEPLAPGKPGAAVVLLEGLVAQGGATRAGGLFVITDRGRRALTDALWPH